jgi:uncharacterized protein YacL
MKFNWWNLLIGLLLANLVSALLDSWGSPGIAHLICWVCIGLAFPWIEIEPKKENKND